VRQELRRVMWQLAGIVRTDIGLDRAERELNRLDAAAGDLGQCGSVDCLEARNLLTVARLVVASARLRPESRGLHFNADHPEKEPAFARETVIERHRSG
jgi:L-aspartate oxidase